MHRQNMLQVISSIKINAAPSHVMGLYLDYLHWNKLFGLTVRSTRFISGEDGVIILAIDHKHEGPVINTLTVVSEDEVKLEEFKRKYNATILNFFQPYERGTLYSVVAGIKLKGIYKMTAPFIRNVIKRRISKFILQPVKKYAEMVF